MKHDQIIKKSFDLYSVNYADAYKILKPLKLKVKIDNISIKNSQNDLTIFCDFKGF